MARKLLGWTKYTFYQGSITYYKKNVIPIWTNTPENFQLYNMADSAMWFKMLTNIISSNSIPKMVVPFILVPLHWQA